MKRPTFRLIVAALVLGVRPLSAPALAAPAAPITDHRPSGWIEYDDASFTPVLDDVSAALAGARSELARQNLTAAAADLAAAARALSAQAARGREIDRRRAAADMGQARDTHRRMVALAARLDRIAARIKAGSLSSTAALDKALGRDARTDLEGRWLVTDVAGWYPVAGEPQRHLRAAAAAYEKHQDRTAATEVRKAAAYLRLESARAAGAAKAGLDAAAAGLDRTARALDRDGVRSEAALDQVFARADHALAIAHRAEAADDWARKSYVDAGYELKAGASALEGATAWAGGEARGAAATAVSDARGIGAKLAGGGVWARAEVEKGFDALGDALNRLGREIHAKTRARRFDTGA